VSSTPSGNPSLREDDKPKTKTRTLASAAKWMSKYKLPMPEGFNDPSVWSQSTKALWVETNRVRPGETPVLPVEESELKSVSSSMSATPPPPPITAAPSQFKWNCPVCKFGAKWSYVVAEHIEKNHPELGHQSFQISCPESGCNWRTGWNKVESNKAAKDAELLDHRETDHVKQAVTWT
jgi:hypothetical protein